jgi:hypothetical protein
MKEILIPAVTILFTFGLPILAMLTDLVATLLEKPRWTLTD